MTDQELPPGGDRQEDTRSSARLIPEVVPDRHIAPEFPDQPAGAARDGTDASSVPTFIEPGGPAAPARPAGQKPAPRPPKEKKPAPPRRERKIRYTLVTVVSTLRSLVLTFAAAVIAATIFMWWTSPDFLPAQARRELAPVQATARQVLATPTGLPTPVWFNRIGVLAGHSGPSVDGLVDPGAECPDGFNELGVTTRVADQVVAMLRGRGFTVDLLQEYDPRLQGYQAAAFISLHADSCENFGYGGFKSAYPSLRMSARNQDLFLNQCLRENYGAVTGLQFLPDNITADMWEYHAFRRIAPATPASILELGFLSYDRDLLQNQTERVALGIVNSLMCFLNPAEPPTIIPGLPVPTPTAQP